MTSKQHVTEEIAFIPKGDDHVFGILTSPSGRPNGLGVVLLAGGAWKFSLQRNRLQVTMARRLASAGFHVLRFDVHGAGESTGSIDRYSLDNPFVDDLEAGVTWLRAKGIDRFVFIGSCIGGRTFLAGAERIDGLRAVALLSTPVMDYDWTLRVMIRADELRTGELLRQFSSRHVLSGFFDRERRARYVKAIKFKLGGGGRRERDDWRKASEHFIEPLSRLVKREIPILLAYGDEPMTDDFIRARDRALGPILEEAGENLQVHIVDHHLHGFPAIWIQRDATDLIEGWLHRVLSDELRELKPVRTKQTVRS